MRWGRGLKFKLSCWGSLTAKVTVEQKPESSKGGSQGKTGEGKSGPGRGNSKCQCPVTRVSLTCVFGAKQIQGKYKRRHQRAMGWAGHEPDYGGSFKASVPNLFGARDRFRFRGRPEERQGGRGDGSGSDVSDGEQRGSGR